MADHVPGLAAVIGQAVCKQSGRADSGLSIGRYKHAIDERVIAGRIVARLNIAEVSERSLLNFARASVDSEALLSGSESVAATDNVGQVETFALKMSDLSRELIDRAAESDFVGVVLLSSIRVDVSIVATNSGKDSRKLVVLAL